MVTYPIFSPGLTTYLHQANYHQIPLLHPHMVHPLALSKKRKSKGSRTLEIQGRVVEWMDMEQDRHFLDP